MFWTDSPVSNLSEKMKADFELRRQTDGGNRPISADLSIMVNRIKDEIANNPGSSESALEALVTLEAVVNDKRENKSNTYKKSFETDAQLNSVGLINHILESEEAEKISPKLLCQAAKTMYRLSRPFSEDEIEHSCKRVTNAVRGHQTRVNRLKSFGDRDI